MGVGNMILLRWASRFSKLIRLSFNVVRVFVRIAGNHRSIALANMGILDQTVTPWLSPAQDTAELQDANSDLDDLPALVTDDHEDDDSTLTPHNSN